MTNNTAFFEEYYRRRLPGQDKSLYDSLAQDMQENQERLRDYADDIRYFNQELIDLISELDAMRARLAWVYSHDVGTFDSFEEWTAAIDAAIKENKL